jgi:hypothetical protein
MKEELEEKLFFFITHRKKLLHIFVGVRDDNGRWKRHLLQNQLGCGNSAAKEEGAYSLHDVVAGAVPEVLRVFTKKAAESSDEIGVDFVQVGFMFVFDQEAKAYS